MTTVGGLVDRYRPRWDSVRKLGALGFSRRVDQEVVRLLRRDEDMRALLPTGQPGDLRPVEIPGPVEDIVVAQLETKLARAERDAQDHKTNASDQIEAENTWLRMDLAAAQAGLRSKDAEEMERLRELCMALISQQRTTLDVLENLVQLGANSQTI